MKDMRSDITKEIVKNINNDLKKFDIVLVFIGSKNSVANWVDFLHKLKVAENARKRILVLSDIDILYMDSCIFEYRKMNVSEWKILKCLYTMYDFSEHFFVLVDEQQYGGLLNYVKTGVMTMKEIFQAVLV